MMWPPWHLHGLAALDSAWVQASATVLVALITGSFGYLIAGRSRVMSQGESRWTEALDLIRELRREVNRLRKENVALRERIDVLERRLRRPERREHG